MNKKIFAVLSLSFLSILGINVTNTNLKAAAYEYETIYYESFDNATGEIHASTIFWGNNASLESNGTDKYIKFNVSQVGENVLGGTNYAYLKTKENPYRVKFDVSCEFINKLTIQVLDSNDDVKYAYPLNVTNNELETGDFDNYSVVKNTSDYTVSIDFDGLSDKTYFAFHVDATDLNAHIDIDNFVFQQYITDVYSYNSVEFQNFNTSEGEIYVSSIFFTHDNEGGASKTKGYFSDTYAINDTRALVFETPAGSGDTWDILGGTSADKLVMKGGQNYNISMKVKMLGSASHLSIQVRKTSNDEVIGEMYFDKNGQRLPSDKYPITEKESITKENDYYNVSFDFSSSADSKAYIYLNGYSPNRANESGYFIIDEVVVTQQNYEKSIVHYEDYKTANFENGEVSYYTLNSVNDSSSGVKNYEYIQQSISGAKSLKVTLNKRYEYNTILTSKINDIEIKNGHFKFHGKFKSKNISSVSIALVNSADDEILQEFNFNPITINREAGIGKAYLDNGLIELVGSTLYASFETLSLKKDATYYIEIKAKPTSTDNYLILDDISVFKEASDLVIDETIAPLPPADKGSSNVISNIINKFDESNVSEITFEDFILMISLVGGISVVGVGLYFIIAKKLLKKKLTKIIYISILAAAVVVSGVSTIPQNKNTDVTTALNKVNKEEKDYTYTYPQRISGNLDNPGMGWVALEEPTYGGHPDLGSTGDIPEVKNISFSTSWASIEVEDGKYDFTLMDKVIEHYRPYNKKINFRICTDTLMLPNTYQGTPLWLIEKYNLPFELNDYTDGGAVLQFRAIDTRSPIYRQYLRRFLDALCEKYKDEAMVDTVEIRGFGNWGEWHSGQTFDSDANRINSLQYIINDYIQAFKNTGKMMVLSCAWDPYLRPYDSYDQYVRMGGYDYLWRQENATFRRDSGANLMDYTTDERILSDAFRSGKRVPLYGEYSSNIDPAFDSAYGFDLDGGLNDILFKMHPNYITVLGWTPSAIDIVNKRGRADYWQRGTEMMGYRLAIDETRYPTNVPSNNSFTLKTDWSNSAVGIFPYTYKLNIYLLDQNNKVVSVTQDSSFDARTFVNGETTSYYSKVDVPSSVSDGSYKIAVAIVDENNSPAIRLAMAGEINNSMMYYIGDVNVSSSAKSIDDLVDEMTYDEALNYKFEPNQTYKLTIDYLPKFDKANYEFGSDDGYMVYLKSDSKNSIVGYNKWQDISSQRANKTFVFTTQSARDYKFNVGSDNYGDIQINKVYIEKVNGYYESFDGYDFTDLDSIYMPINKRSAKLESQYPISGSDSVQLSGTGEKDIWCMKTDSSVYNLKPNTTYTISFKFKSTSLISKGGLMKISLYDEEKREYSKIAEFYEREDLAATTKTFTFTTSSSNSQSIRFGLENGGAYLIDDLTLIENAKGQIIDGPDFNQKTNTLPNIDYAGLGEVEGFEGKSFGYFSYDSGQFGWGQVTYNPDYVISGEASLMGNVEKDAMVCEWFEFAKSKPSAIKFEYGKTYDIKFKYRVIKNPNDGGYFYYMLRDSTLGNGYDIGYQQINALPAGQLNQVLEHSSRVTITNNGNNYQLVFGMRWQGIIAIDDVIVSEVV